MNNEDIILEAKMDKKISHYSKNTQTTLWFMTDQINSLDKNQALMQQELKNQWDKIDSNHEEIMNAVCDMSKTFAKKSDLDNIKEKVNGHSGYFKWVMVWFGWMLLTAIWKAIWL